MDFRLTWSLDDAQHIAFRLPLSTSAIADMSWPRESVTRRKLSPINEAPAAGTADTRQYMPIFRQARTRPETTGKRPRRSPSGQGRVLSGRNRYGSLSTLLPWEKLWCARPTGLAWRVAGGFMCAHRQRRRHFPLVTFLATGVALESFVFAPNQAPFCGAGV
jgi:hypothetical protein